jgi:hypothetical protein
MSPISLDTTAPAGKFMFQITGAFAEFERSMASARRCLASLRYDPTRVLVLTQKAVLCPCVNSLQPLFGALRLLLISRGLCL